jgi:multidrug efflux pump subunit AcrB
MWIVRLALRRPYTFVVMAILIVIMGFSRSCALQPIFFRTSTFRLSASSGITTGLVPEDMSDRIVSVTERALTTTVDNIEHIESQSLYGTAVVKVFLQPTRTFSRASRRLRLSLRLSSGSCRCGNDAAAHSGLQRIERTRPATGTFGPGLSEQELNDYGLNFIRTQLITVPGASVPYPYGGKQRQVQVDLNPRRCSRRVCLRWT